MKGMKEDRRKRGSAARYKAPAVGGDDASNNNVGPGEDADEALRAVVRAAGLDGPPEGPDGAPSGRARTRARSASVFEQNHLSP